MWEEGNNGNSNDHALTLNLQAYGDDASTCSSSEASCVDSAAEETSVTQQRRGTKRKRSDDEANDEDDEDTDDTTSLNMPDVVHQMEAEIERQLDSKAKKSNLTVANVKNILKDVITNEQVLELVRHTMKEPKSNFCISKVFSYAPKLTRAKTRELLNTFPSMAWPITKRNIKNNSKCKVLIEQDLSEDSSDEEYKPDEDDDHEDTEKQMHEHSNDNDDQYDDDDDEGGEQPDSDDAGAQGDEDEDEDDDDEEIEHESEENSTSHESGKSDAKSEIQSAKGNEEDEEEEDDDDCRLIICDIDSDNQEFASSTAINEKSVGHQNIFDTKKNNDTSTQTTWLEVASKKNLSNKEVSLNEKTAINTEENICQRTRSKLSLNDTPLETIENAFVPPDITTDMYDSECDDEDWKNFLKGFTIPLRSQTQDTPEDDDDEETDPEYKIMFDEEEADDKEELREDRGVMVSRKEVNALMAELFEYIGMLSDDKETLDCYDLFNNEEFCEAYQHKNNDELEYIAEHIAGALEEHSEINVQVDSVSHANEGFSLSNETYSSIQESCANESFCTTETIQDKTDVFSCAQISSLDRISSPKKSEAVSCKISASMVMLIEQQMRKYVQLLTQHFLLTYLHPLFHVHSIDCKQNLVILKHHAKNNKKSTYFADNLDEAIALIERWEQWVSLDERKKEYMEYIDKEIELQNIMKKRKQFYRGQFPPKFFEIVCNSVVFCYPSLLPTNPFRCDGHSTTPFCRSEDQLIALGLEQFIRYAKKNPKVWGKVTVPKIVPMIVEHYLPARRRNSVYTRILECSNIEGNPIWYFFQNNSVPKTVHFVIPHNALQVPPLQQPLQLLPQVWKEYILSKKQKK